LCDETAKLREIEGPLSTELRRAGNVAALGHGLKLAGFEPEDCPSLLGRTALNGWARLVVTLGLGMRDGQAAAKAAILAPCPREDGPRGGRRER
jgi:hypothetical protein